MRAHNRAMKTLAQFTDWMWAVIKQWIPWVGGSAFVVIVDWGHRLGAWGEPGKSLFWGVVGLGFFMSMFLSWKVERDSLTASKLQEESLAAKLKEIDDAKPRLILRNVYTEKVDANQNGIRVMVANVVRAKFENTPSSNYPNNEAKQVIAKVSFYDPNGNLILEMDGRWTDSTQPLAPHWVSRVPLLETDFRIGATHDLDIAFRDVTFTQVYGDGPQAGLVALNNDNFLFQRWRKPEHVLAGDRFTVKIRLCAVWVNTEFSMEFWAMPNGEIGVSPS